MPNKPIYFKSYGSPATGLSPTWESLKKLDTGSDFTPQPAVSEVGGGWYRYDIALAENLVGVLDGGVAVPASERYNEVFLDKEQYNHEVIVIPVYDEDADVLTVISMMHKNGKLVTANLTNCSIVFYDKTGGSLFTLTSTTFANGVSVLTKSTPAISENAVYYCVATITCDGEDYTSADTFVGLE
jgi:hypothetical protein